MQIASQIALAGRRLTADEALRFHLINKVSRSKDTLVNEAIELAAKIVSQSPDAVIVTRHGLREAWETASVERAVQLTSDVYEERLLRTENRVIGLRAFKTKSSPQWIDSKL